MTNVIVSRCRGIFELAVVVHRKPSKVSSLGFTVVALIGQRAFYESVPRSARAECAPLLEEFPKNACLARSGAGDGGAALRPCHMVQRRDTFLARPRNRSVI